MPNGPYRFIFYFQSLQLIIVPLYIKVFKGTITGTSAQYGGTSLLISKGIEEDFPPK